MTIVLPHPPKACHPNSRAHWRVKAKGVKSLREWTFFAVRASDDWFTFFKPLTRATVQVRAVFRTKRNRDADNILASLKGAFDGLQDAGVIANDSGLVFLPVEILVDARDPRVEIVVEPIQETQA